MKKKLSKPIKKARGAYSDENIGRALILAGGFQSVAAELIGMNHCHLCVRVKESKYLQEIIELASERMLDEGEVGLRKLIEEQNLGAICFLLKTKGKKRGYSENVPVMVPKDMADSLQAVMKQLADAQESRRSGNKLLSNEEISP